MCALRLQATRRMAFYGHCSVYGQRLLHKVVAAVVIVLIQQP